MTDVDSDTPREDEAPEQDESASVTELVVQLGRDLSLLSLCEARLAASRNMPQVRRTVRDLLATLVVAVAFAAGFVLLNVAAVTGLATAMPSWAAALVLAAAWLVVGGAVLLALSVRAGHVTGWSWWRALRGGPEDAQRQLEEARADAIAAVRATLEQLAKAITVEIAAGAVPIASGMAEGVVDVGESLIDAADEGVEELVDDLPGGSVVNQIWDVALMPGRFGLRVATTVLKREEAAD